MSKEKKKYPVIRDMDGVYFRVKRDGKYRAVCWSDLTDDEREQMGENRTLEWWRSMALIMTKALRMVADELNTRADWTCRDTGESRLFRCSECGFGIEDAYLADEGAYGLELDFVRFCPSCGRRVV